jgi:alcohol dehydrogenase (cytochrome c)
LTYSGNLLGWRHSPLTELTPANVSQLRLRWANQFSAPDLPIQSTPIVADGTIFLTVPPGNIVALDARTGALRWKFERALPADLPLCCGRANRGLALLGHTLFMGTLDAHLLAIDADDGKLIWDIGVASPAEGYSITSAPLIAGNSVVIGISGGEFGIRGFLTAYDATTGKKQWRFSTIPGPGELGHDTWKGDAWRSGGGPTWVTGSYDPVLDLIYWGVGNPAPPFLGEARPGDNLFTNSVIALRANTGELAWYFQFTPHDEFDRDSAQTPILADVVIRGISRKVICWANRNGFYYVLDRVTGEFLLGTPFVEQNWTEGLDAKGRPTRSESEQNSNFGRLIRPGINGGTNWQPPSFDPALRIVFVPVTEGASVFAKSSLNELRRGQGGLYVGSGFTSPEPIVPVIRALDAATGVKKWEYFPPPSEELGSSGLLSTAGGMLMGASGGYLFALDAATGREVWRVFLGGITRAPPITFELDGHQMVAVSGAASLFLFNL